MSRVVRRRLGRPAACASARALADAPPPDRRRWAASSRSSDGAARHKLRASPRRRRRLRQRRRAQRRTELQHRARRPRARRPRARRHRCHRAATSPKRRSSRRSRPRPAWRSGSTPRRMSAPPHAGSSTSGGPAGRRRQPRPHRGGQCRCASEPLRVAARPPPPRTLSPPFGLAHGALCVRAHCSASSLALIKLGSSAPRPQMFLDQYWPRTRLLSVGTDLRGFPPLAPCFCDPLLSVRPLLSHGWAPAICTRALGSRARHRRACACGGRVELVWTVGGPSARLGIAK